MASLKHKLSGFGLSPDLVNEIAAELEREATHDRKPTRFTDWTLLLTPLRFAIKSLQSTQSRWGEPASPKRKVYTMYLELLCKTRTVIEFAHRMPNEGETIPQRHAAMSSKFTGNGLDWPDWVPPKVRHKCIIEIERYQADNPKGKRLIPFYLPGKIRSSERRWTRLLVSVTEALDMAQASTGEVNEEYIKCCQSALDAITKRDKDAIAPVHWRQLLTPAQREATQAPKRRLTAEVLTTLSDWGGPRPSAIAKHVLVPFVWDDAERSEAGQRSFDALLGKQS
jgi:hypothetical protein